MPRPPGHKLSKKTKLKIGLANKKKNPGYDALHKWVRSKNKQSKKCQHCKKEKEYKLLELASNGNYSRNIKDYEWLCRGCHIKKDLHLYPRGEKQGLSKLTEKQVKKIRSLYKYRIVSFKKLSEKYNVQYNTIWSIVKRRTWKHIK